MPKKPEEWLEVASPSSNARGIFKLFLGYAPGVGKTYSMLSEAIRRKSRGEDVVIGIIETLSGFYLPEGFKDVAAYVVLLGVLMLRPEGLFGLHLRKKV